MTTDEEINVRSILKLIRKYKKDAARFSKGYPSTDEAKQKLNRGYTELADQLASSKMKELFIKCYAPLQAKQNEPATLNKKTENGNLANKNIVNIEMSMISKVGVNGAELKTAMTSGKINGAVSEFLNVKKLYDSILAIHEKTVSGIDGARSLPRKEKKAKKGKLLQGYIRGIVSAVMFVGNTFYFSDAAVVSVSLGLGCHYLDLAVRDVTEE